MSPAPGFTHLIPDEELRDLLEGLIASAPAAIMITDSDGRVIGVNEAHTRLTGLTFERIVLDLRMNFRHYLKTVHPPASAELERAYRGEAIQIFDFFYQVKPPPGVPPLTEKLAKGFWINTRAFPIRNARGEVAYVVILNEDITARKDLEAILAQTQKLETIGTLSGGIAHDFNNILSVVMGYASQLESLLPEGSPEHEATQHILEAVDRATSLTTRLLTIARKAPPSLAILRLQDLLPRTVEFLSRTLDPNHSLEMEVAEDTFEVEADRHQIEQVLMNLCLNARDAMPQGGVIRIAAGNQTITESNRPLPIMPPGDYVLVSVTDMGVGMPPEVLAHIFEPFFTTKPAGRGTGLGLAVTYGIVKAHRGFITVRWSPGEGTEFRVFLPRSPVPGQEPTGD